jgi:hypothetical protein
LFPPIVSRAFFFFSIVHLFRQFAPAVEAVAVLSQAYQIDDARSQWFRSHPATLSLKDGCRWPNGPLPHAFSPNPATPPSFTVSQRTQTAILGCLKCPSILPYPWRRRIRAISAASAASPLPDPLHTPAASHLSCPPPLSLTLFTPSCPPSATPFSP